MSRDEQVAYRFLVRAADGRRSATWRVWTGSRNSRPTDDVYVAPRSLGGEVKVSLHRDGQCLYKLTQEANPRARLGDRQALQRWAIQEPVSGTAVRLGLRIRFPEDELVPQDGDDVGVAVVDAPPVGSVLMVLVLVSDKPMDVTTSDLEVLAVLERANGGQVAVVCLSPPGSRHLRGLSLTPTGLTALGDADSATWLFRPAGEPSAAAWQYIEAGDVAGVPLAYKCRVRTPWWRVPLVRPADLLLTYMNADTPRLTTNRAKAHHLNSVHGVYLRDELREAGQRLLPLGSLTSMTLLGAETVGRAYGGGMLKLEPGEADLLPVAAPDLLRAASGDLTRIRPAVASHLRAGRLLDAVALVDDVLLTGHLGVSPSQLSALRDAHANLTARRTARGNDTAPRP